MKKLILTIALSFIGVAAFAQNNTTTQQRPKNSTNTTIKPIVLRMTNDMSNDDIGLELINNFYKIELSDVTPNKRKNASLKNSMQYNMAGNSIENDTNIQSYNIILDLAVRTTTDMRPSIYSTEETTA